MSLGNDQHNQAETAAERGGREDVTDVASSSSTTIPPLTRSDSSSDDSSMDLSRSHSDDSSMETTTKQNDVAEAVPPLEADDPLHYLTTTRLDISRQFQEGLKYNSQEEEQQDSKDNNKYANKQPCVHFDDTVLGVEISSHRDYPESIRQRIWSTLHEIQTNANRNIIEFRADDWNWRNATEEDCMMVESSSLGRLVHPASFKPCNKKAAAAHKRKQQLSERKRSTRLRRRKVRQY